MIMKLLILPIFTLLCILATSSQAPFFREPKQNYNEITIKPSKIQGMKKIAYKSAGPKFDYKGHVDPKDVEKLAAYVGDFGVLGSHKLFRNKRSAEDWLELYNEYLKMIVEAIAEEMVPKIAAPKVKTLGKDDNDILGQHKGNTDQTGESAPPTSAINLPPVLGVKKPDDDDDDDDGDDHN